jgi:DnaK suppressor protein
MDPKELENFRIRLQGLLADLEGEVSETVTGMRSDAEPFPDPNDRASLESDRNLTLRIRDRERKLRSKIEEALARIDDGTFGICETCGEPIGLKRLEARPVTTLCVACKESQEDQEVKQHLA